MAQKMPRHWETYLYSFAVAYAQRQENAAAMRRKAIAHGHTEAQCAAVEAHPRRFIIMGEV